ncbi:MAG: arsenite methyltransferase [Gemmatimonadota bacterium]
MTTPNQMEESARRSAVETTQVLAESDLKEEVRRRYARAAEAAAGGQRATCGPVAPATGPADVASENTGCGCGCGCGPEADATGTERRDPITDNLYSPAEASVIPQEAVLASLGCGNPTALADLAPGEVVLDLGSGGGIDVLLSAGRVGPTGKAYGLDMTDEMLELARENQKRAGVENVQFLKGDMESIPLPDASVDVIISNCVINLAADKGKVLREAFRVLRPGGRLAISDVVVDGPVPPEIQRSMELWIGCIAGALQIEEYLTLLEASGFEGASVEITRRYRTEAARSFLEEAGLDPDELAEQVDDRFAAAFIRARHP